MRHVLSALIAAVLLTGASPAKVAYQWHTLYVPAYTEAYSASSEPVIALAYAKENTEIIFRVCAAVEGDGELLLAYGGEGDGTEFHAEDIEDVCATAYVGTGGNGIHANHLDVYLFYYEGKEPTIARPVIKVGSN